jgi:hypothetical protein
MMSNLKVTKTKAKKGKRETREKYKGGERRGRKEVNPTPSVSCFVWNV